MSLKKLAAVRGFSLLELLISVSLLTVALSLLTTTIKSLTKGYLTSKRENHIQQVQQRLKNEIRFSFYSLDSHRLEISPKIHKNGIIEFPNGVTHSLTLRKDALGIKHATDAISIMEVDYNKALQVMLWDKLGTPTKVCPLRLEDVKQIKEQSNLSKSKLNQNYYLGFGFDRKISYRQKHYEDNFKTCSKIALSEFNNIAQGVSNIHSYDPPRILLPITRIISIYLDRKNELRIATHKGERVLSNQPFASGIEDLKFRMSRRNTGKTYSINAMLRIKNKNTNLSVQNYLSRKKLEHIIY